MYISLIRPLLEYVDTIWDNISQELKNDIKAVQREAARIFTGATKLCNTDMLISEFRLDTLFLIPTKHSCGRGEIAQFVKIYFLLQI